MTLLPRLPFPFLHRLQSFRLRAVLSGVTGVLLVLCFPQPNLSFLVWVAGVPLLAALLAETSLRRAFLLGYLAGVIFILFGCGWIAEVIRFYGGLPRLLSLGVLLLFSLLFAVFFGFYGLAVGALGRWSRVLALLSAPVVWVACEYGRTHLFTGFGWNLLGYAVAPQGLRGLATVTGVYGLSFLAVATQALILGLVLFKRVRGVQATALAWVGLLVGGNWMASPPPVARKLKAETVYLVQPNIPLQAPESGPSPGNGGAKLPSADWQEMLRRTALWVREHSHSRPPLVIWPESPAPFYYNRDAAFRASVNTLARSMRAFLILGVVNFSAEDLPKDPPKPRNTAVMISPEGSLRLEYDKIHLVPFGEYVPAWAFPDKIGKITAEAGHFVPGRDHRVGETDRGKLGVFICYEAVFPDLVRRFAQKGAGVLVTISNDAWFGRSSAPEQHFAMVRMRAIENRRYVLRAANDGITAVLDPYGRVVERLVRFEPAILKGTFEYRSGRTFYTRFGDVFAWFCCLSVAAAFAVGGALRRRKKVSEIEKEKP